MGDSVETEVEFVNLDRYDLEYWMLHEGKRYEEEPRISEITHRARKKIKDAEEGDIIQVVWNYDARGYPIVEAKMITGSAEEQVRLLTERVETLVAVIDGIPDVIRKAADAVGGDRYEEAKRVQHAVARALEDHIQRGGKAVVDPVLLYSSRRGE